MVCCLTGRTTLHAQEYSLFFENYTSEKGLSQNSGYALTQDHQGFIWVGTQDGLNRFDGIGFKVFRNNEKDSSSLPFNEISALHTDTRGNLWIGSPMGIAVYFAQNNRFYAISEFFRTSAEMDHLPINKIFEDRSNIIWILTRYNGLYCFDPVNKKLGHFLFDKQVKDKLTGITQDKDNNIWVSSIRTLYKLGTDSLFRPVELDGKQGLPDTTTIISDLSTLNDELWVGTLRNGIYIFNTSGTTQRLQKHLQMGSSSLQISSNEIKCLLKDRHNNMWIGTRNAGLCQYISESGQFVKGRQSYFTDNSLNKNFVLSLFEDNQGILWAGLSGGGLAKYDPDKFQFQAYRQQPGSDNSFSDNMIFCIYGKTSHEVMVGTQNGGLMVFNTQTREAVAYKNIPGNEHSLLNNTVYSIAKDDSNHYWIATWGGLCRYNANAAAGHEFTSFKNTGLTANLYSVIKLKHSNNLLASGPGGLFSFDPGKGSWRPVKDPEEFTEKHSIVVRYFLETDGDNIWLATEGMGLLNYNYSTGVFEEHPEVYKLTGNVRYILPRPDGLWLATDNGMMHYNTATKKISSVWTTRDGLPNNVVYGILEDGKDHLWLSTNNGLSCFNAGTHSFKNYDISYGLQGMEFNTASCYRDEAGNLYFGGINGMNVFDPASLSSNRYAPAVHITALKVFDDEVSTPSNISFTNRVDLKYDQNFITIEFTALNYSHTERNTYSYMLEDVDESWIDVGKRNFATYTQLLPGKYLFKVKATNSDGKWSNEIKQIQIVVHPPFWSTWWFRSVILILIGGMVFWLYKLKTNQIRNEERLKADFNKKITDAETAALRAQMNPHFIFNTLNSINSYIIENNPRVASDYLTKFARLIRIILDNSKNESIPLSREIETLKLYLLMESVRFNKKFDYEITIDKMLDEEEIRIPPMIIQPYVENAIWHGLLHKTEKGKATIVISRKQQGVLQVNITDNGIGRQKATEMKSKDSNGNKSYGMKITSDRLMMNNGSNRVETIDLTDGFGNATGTTVILSITI